MSEDRLEELRKVLEASGKSARAFAVEDLGVSPSYLYDILRGGRTLSDKIKGYLDERKRNQRPAKNKNG